MAVSITREGKIAIVTIDNPPVNAISHLVRAGLLSACEEIDRDDDVAAAILICAGRSFMAGADIREFGQPAREPHLPDLISRIEASRKPWIASMHGNALGGGLEIALGCHYRIAAKGTKLGLPEVNLGLIPGAGGTVRLPRLIDPFEALRMIASGKPISASRALELGLVDELAPAFTDNAALKSAALQFAKTIAPHPPREPLSAHTPAPINAEDWEAEERQIQKRARGQNSPMAAAKIMASGLGKSGAEALADERAEFLRLKDDPQSAALRHIFFAERSVSRIERLKGQKPPAIERIGIIGGGLMGAGIAANCLLSGIASVRLLERDEKALGEGIARINALLDASKKRGLLDERAREELAARLSGTTEYAKLDGVQIAIEAVFEDMEVKKEVFRALEAATDKETILASNTSYLDINEIASAIKHQERVIGLHFFSPAHIMKLLEVVMTNNASDAAIAAGMLLGKKLGKIAVPSGVCDGFIGNRVMSAYRQECDYMLEDGALPHEIDAAMKEFGFPMGIFEMQDMAGLQIGWAARKRRAPTRPAEERYVDIADKLCEAGRFGRKTGKGWYLYAEKGAEIDPEVTKIILEASTRKGVERKEISAKEIMARILGRMQSEGAKIVEEGIAQSPEAVDVVMVNGYGFPRWRAGPLYMHENS